jgi:hypothetical protein
MSELDLRPRFRLEVNNTENEVVDIVKNKLKYDNPHHFESTIVEGHLILRISKEKRHYWSPQMDISLQTQEDGGTLIRCLLAPEASVWTMFMFFYAATGFMAFVGLMMGMSQWTLQRDMWGFYIFLAGIVLGLIVYAIAQFGKGISRSDLKILKAFFTEINWN